MPPFDCTPYKISDEYPADKESLWNHTPEQSGWTLAHNALRAEMTSYIEALEAVKQQGALKAWQVKALQTIFEGHFEHVHGHHHNEDEILAPEMQKRFKYPKNLVTDHDGLVKKLNNCKKAAEDLKEGGTVDHLLKVFKDYEQYMLPHLKEEEDIGLPLTRAFFSPAEFGVIIQKIIKNSPKIEMGSFIHCCGVEYFRKTFMPQEGIPFFVWYVEFASSYAIFLKTNVENIEALKSGKEPAPKSPGFCDIL